MAYCTISDVNSYVAQQPFTATTTPTQAQVEAFIAQIANQLDLTLANIGYVTPVVSGAKSLIELKKANAWGALGIAQQVRITAVAPDQAVGVSVWTKMLNEWLKRLTSNTDPFELGDAPRTNKAVVKPIGELQRDLISDSIDSGTTEDPNNYMTNPIFSIGMKF